MAGRPTRTSRTPIDGFDRRRLTVKGKDPNYQYYIVNDTDDRVDRFKERGWEVVSSGEVTVGDKRVTLPTATDSACTVSVGGGVDGVLMKIKREWWEEDQAAKQANSQSLVKETVRDAKKGSDYGSIKLNNN